MTALPISNKSDWQQPQIEHFLDTQHTPMRLAVADHDDFTVICSVWFYY